ncbi:MAG: carboxypeptidase regulatory-like domain-containing protein [Fidelibacterota bacterium]
MNRSLSAGIGATLLFGYLTCLTAGGAVSGTVRYEGKIPKLRSFDMAIEPVCVMKHEQDPEAYPARSEALVLGEGSTMANIFVQISRGLPDKEWEVPEEPVVLNQDGCRYEPHVLGLMVGQPLKFLNSDGVLHNLHALPNVNDEFNVTMPKFLKETTRSFEFAEDVFPIKCDVHPWMGGFIAVTDHPFFDVTEKDGVYTISDLEPGTYTVEAWHEKLGSRTATVTIEKDETRRVDFTFKR